MSCKHDEFDDYKVMKEMNRRSKLINVRDETTLLVPNSPPPMKPEDLDGECEHYEYKPGIKRYKCEHCLAVWVRCVSPYVAANEAMEREVDGQTVCANRIVNAIIEVKHLRYVDNSTKQKNK